MRCVVYWITAQVVPVLLLHLTKLSSVRVYLPKDLRPQQNRKVVRTAIEEVKKRFPDGLPLLNPVKDMHISDDEFRKIVQVWVPAVIVCVCVCVCVCVLLPIHEGSIV